MTKVASWWPAVAVSLGVAAAIALAVGSLPAPVGCSSPSSSGSGGTPLGTAMAFGTPVEESQGSDHWYNFSVASAGGGVQFQNLRFGVQTPTGAPVAPSPGWTATMLDHSGQTVGVFAIFGPNAGNWTEGGSTPLTSEQTFSLLSTPTVLHGDDLLISETGSFPDGCSASGLISVSIP